MKPDYDIQQDVQQGEKISIDEIIDIYADKYYLCRTNYMMMGELLRHDIIDKIVGTCQGSPIYIYGGGYLGIQLLRAIEDKLIVKAVVDQAGECLQKVNVRVIRPDQLNEKETRNCKVIITPIHVYDLIKKKLESFFREEDIWALCEIIGGEL